MNNKLKNNNMKTLTATIFLGIQLFSPCVNYTLDCETYEYNCNEMITKMVSSNFVGPLNAGQQRINNQFIF